MRKLVFQIILISSMPVFGQTSSAELTEIFLKKIGPKIGKEFDLDQDQWLIVAGNIKRYLESAQSLISFIDTASVEYSKAEINLYKDSLLTTIFATTAIIQEQPSCRNENRITHSVKEYLGILAERKKSNATLEIYWIPDSTSLNTTWSDSDEPPIYMKENNSTIFYDLGINTSQVYFRCGIDTISSDQLEGLMNKEESLNLLKDVFDCYADITNKVFLFKILRPKDKSNPLDWIYRIHAIKVRDVTCL